MTKSGHPKPSGVTRSWIAQPELARDSNDVFRTARSDPLMRCEWHPAAESELNDIALFYSKQDRPGLAVALDDTRRVR